MRIINQLSSQTGDRSQTANALVAAQCLSDPDLLVEISEGLGSWEAAIAGDCAEIMTMVAAKHPERVSPFSAALIRLLDHKTTRVRWEAMHSLAYIVEVSPEVVATILPRLEKLVQNDKSIIVRDYAVDAVAGYAHSGPEAAEAAFPVLKMALETWDGKHAGHALRGLAFAAAVAPGLRDEVRTLAQPFLEDRRGVVRKVAREAIEAAK